MNNSLARNHNTLSLIKFALPTIIVMVFTSLYTMVDGIFIANFVNSDALSSINIVFPALSIVIGVAIMLATGAGASIAKKMGEGKNEEAKRFFSFILLVGLVIGLLLFIIGKLFLKDIIFLLGSTDALYQYCEDYLGLLVNFLPFAIFQLFFQFFFVTAGKPALGLIGTVFSGILNILLDYVFIVPLNMGISGAALGTGLSYVFAFLFGLIYFAFNRKGMLYITKPKCDFKLLGVSCFNGISEMISNLANAITTILFNFYMLKFAGEDGVAAITILLYSQFLLTSVYMGFSSGVAPVFSYNYGNKNGEMTKKIFKISFMFICISSVAFFGMSYLLAKPVISVFVRPGTHAFELARSGFNLFAICFLFAGINIFASSLFTSFSNGLISGVISVLRTLVFIVLSIVVMSEIWGITGVWLAIPIAEILTLIFSCIFLIVYRKKYSY